MMPDVDLSRIHAATEGLSRLLLVLARALRRTPGRVELAGELAAARIHLDRLAEMVGADLVEEDREEILREVALCFQGYLPFPQPHPGPTPGALFPAVPPEGQPAPGGSGGGRGGGGLMPCAELQPCTSGSTEKEETEMDARLKEQVASIRERLEKFNEKHEFKPGDVVVQKSELESASVPTKNSPGVVVKVLDEPIYDTGRDSGDICFMEPLDVIVATLPRGMDGPLGLYHFDSRRLEPFTPEAAVNAFESETGNSYRCTEFAAAKRASMDLTRALVPLRRSVYR